jgi:predicted aspartyl protease
MVRIGITGHSNLTPDSVPLVAAAIEKVLAEHDGPITGVSCLARGADQVFARAVLDTGGTLAVILPARDYRERKVKPDNREAFESLIERAASVQVMPFETSNRDAYAAAGDAVLADVDLLVAVWDGAPPDGKGGTGDTVMAARERGVPVTVVWPAGGRRE